MYLSLLNANPKLRYLTHIRLFDNPLFSGQAVSEDIRGVKTKWPLKY